MDNKSAKIILDSMFEISDKFSQSITDVEPTLSVEELKIYKRQVGQIMGEMQDLILNEIISRHPELKPDGWD